MKYTSLSYSILVRALWVSGLFIAGLWAASIYGVLPQSVWSISAVAALMCLSVIIPLEGVLLQPLRNLSREITHMRKGEPYGKVPVNTNSKEMHELTCFFNEAVDSFEEVEDNLIDQRRLAEELEVARTVQKKLLPQSMPTVPGLQVVIKTRNASEVGGDNFDILPSDKRTLLYVGDATGHGTAAGLVMSMVNVLMHGAGHLSHTPPTMLSHINTLLTPKLTSSMFMTLALLRWEHEENHLYLTGCGHEHVLVYRADTGNVERIKPGGIALGMAPDISSILKEQHIAFNEKDVVVLFTDGITEARKSDGEMVGLDALEQVLKRSGGLGKASGIFEAMSRELKELFPQEDLKDDITLAVIQRKEEAASGLSVKEPLVAGASKSWDWE